MLKTVVIVSAVVLSIGLDAQAQKTSGGSVIGATSGPGIANPIVTAPPIAYATSSVIDMTGRNSWDLPGALVNEWVFDPAGVGANLSALSWDVTIRANGASWLSESRIYFDGSDQDGSGLWLTPGVADGFPGTGSYASGGIIDLTDNGIPDVPVLADGLLHMELNESFDDVPGAIDNNWLSGNVTLYYDADCGDVLQFGAACAGSNGLPNMEVGCAQVGLPMSVSVTNAEGGSPWFVLLSTGTGSIGLPGGCTLDLAAGFFIQPMGPMPAAGEISFNVTPPAPFHIFVQSVIKDSVANFVTTNGLDITVNP